MMKVLLNSDDMGVMECGTDCLRAYIRVAAQQIQSWTDGTTTGQELILSVFRRQLDPEFPENALNDVGMTITQYLKKAEGIDGELMEGIFDAVLTKLATLKMTVPKVKAVCHCICVALLASLWPFA
jgi:hypothetical protein